MVFSLRQLARRMHHPLRRARKGQALEGANRFRPRLECLECRLAPATVRFSNLEGGDWWTDGNWLDTTTMTHHVPTATDDAVIDPQHITVTYNRSTAEMVRSLTL
jgi:hypothetical protein